MGPITNVIACQEILYYSILLLTMKQIYVVIFVGLLFCTITLAKETRVFKKSYIAEFTPKWPTLRAQSAVCNN